MAIISRKENESINYKQKKTSVNIKNKISCQKKNLRRNRYKLNVFSRQSYEYPEISDKKLIVTSMGFTFNTKRKFRERHER